MANIVTYGRSGDNDRVIEDRTVSRWHCQIVERGGGEYEIIDLNSSNGTYVNGRRIVGSRRLNRDDVVRIGNTTLPWITDFETDLDDDGLMPPPPPQPGWKEMVVFLFGVISVSILAYLIIKFFSSPGMGLVNMIGGGGSMIKLFPLWLHGGLFMSGQWVPMVLALITGLVAEAVWDLSDMEDETIVKIGYCLAKVGIGVASALLLLALFAPLIYK